ncbi:MAG: amino acid racemase [Bacteroidales bacterium]|nr:amino acid racemase [Bacteroidales bacterium]
MTQEIRKRIGLIGGAGAPSTIEYYSRIISKYSSLYNDMNFPELLIYSLSHGKIKGFEDNMDKEAYIDYLGQAARVLEKTDVDYIAIAANSPHSVIDELKEITSIPFISALDSSVNEAVRLKLKKVLLIGIRFTMQSTFFQKRFEAEDIDVRVPSEEDQQKIHSVIYDELMKGVKRDYSRILLETLINSYPVDGVILGCMRLPLLLKNGESKITYIDTLDLHTIDVLNASVGRKII